MSWSEEERARYDDGWAALCCRVVQQWQRDGSPKAERDDAMAWQRLLKEHEKIAKRQLRRAKLV